MTVYTFTEARQHLAAVLDQRYQEFRRIYPAIKTIP